MAYLLGVSDYDLLLNQIEVHQDIYETYHFASRYNLVQKLKQKWPKRASFEAFLANTSLDAPHVCFIRVREIQTQIPQVAFRLATEQILAQEEGLRNKEKCPVFLSQLKVDGIGYQDYWKALVKDVATKLHPLIIGSTPTLDLNNADACLRAIENAECLSPSHHAHHICFVEGVARAYDRTSGCDPTRDWTIKCETEQGQAEPTKMRRVTGDDYVERTKVRRLTKALEGLFENGAGKVVFLVPSDFAEFDYLIAKYRHVVFFDY